MKSMWHVIASCLVVAVFQSCTSPNPVSDDYGYPEVKVADASFGNRRVRAVWLQGGNCEDGGGMLVGYDTKNAGLHTILPQSDSLQCNWPHLLSGGTRVAFTDAGDRACYKTYIVNWDGTGLTYVTDGGLSSIWRDQSTDAEWAIVRTGGADTTGAIIRYRIDNPNEQKLLWNKTGVGSRHSAIWYYVSADGLRACGTFPWSRRSFLVYQGGLQTNGSIWEAPSTGCWYSMAPDNSYLWFHFYWNTKFNGHTGISLYRDATSLGTVEFQSRGKTEEHFHAKFSANDSRHIAATVGYGDKSCSALNGVEVVVGRLAPDSKSFESWVQLTRNTEADYAPDVWFDVDANLPALSDSTLDSAKTTDTLSEESVVTILTPTGAQSYSDDDTIHLTWTVADAQAVSGWLIDVTADEGLSWESLNPTGALPGSVRILSIPVREVLGVLARDEATIVVRVRDYFSSGIRGQSPELTVGG